MRRFLQKLKKIIFWILALHIVFVLYCWVFNPPVTVTQLTNMVKYGGIKRDYISFSEMGKLAPLAVLAAEDQVFPDHSGFDWKSIEKAISHNEKKPAKIRGASTLSQQVAKNVFLWQGRSWIRKGLEVYFTFLIETLYSKQRILELYLNVVEMGEGIFGIEAAAQAYFGKSAAQLNYNEASQIAACLPNPKVYKVKPLSSYVAKRSGWIQRQMRNLEGDPDIRAVIDGNKPKEKETINNKKKKK